MTNSKMTKRALFTSIMALMLCFAMLTGTTFAWFTDQETSANNQIIAGNLDIEMYNALATEITDATAPIDATTPLFDGIKLEPGAVVYENITVANKGNLALKYQLSVNFTDGGLAKALKVAVVDGGITTTDRATVLASIAANAWMPIASFTTDVAELKVTNETDTYGIVIYWEPSANDNDYNGKNNTLDIGLTLFATQLAAEKDAFDENYDKDANIVSAPVAIPDDATEAIVLVSSDVKVSVPAAVANALPAEVTSISIAYTEPKVDTTTNTVTFDSIELVDQNGKEIDLTNNKEPIEVTLPAQTAILAGENVVVMHDGRVVGSAVVAADGSISYMANHFCEVSVVPVVKVATADELVAAIAKGGNYQLTADITISDPLSIVADTAIYGFGKTITYTGSNRAIDIPNNADAKVNVTLDNLTVDCTASYCERGVNYNDNGALTLNKVTVSGTNVTYALNLPGSSDNANVVINNSALTGNIALNVWGENATITANNTVFTSVDKAATENYSAIVLNNDGTSVANGTVIYVNGGKIIAHDEKGALSNAVRNGTTTGKVEISDSTEVIGNSNRPVAIVDYGTAQFYSSTTLQAAIDKAIATNGNVKLITNIVLDKPIVVDGTVAIDLNGHNITYTVPAVEQTYHAIIVKGDLTVRGKGTIALYDKSGAAFNSGIQSTAISVAGGTLTLNEGVTVLSDAGAEMAYAVDVNTTLGNSVLNVNGAELKSSYIGVRVFNNNKTGKGTVNYNSGVIDGEKKGYDIWVQNLGQPAENAVVNIADGINYTSESLSGTMYYID